MIEEREWDEYEEDFVEELDEEETVQELAEIALKEEEALLRKSLYE